MSRRTNQDATETGRIHPDVDRLEAENASLRAKLGELEAVLDGIADGVMFWDSSHHLRFANIAAARSLGYSSVAELLATPATEMMQPFEVLDEDLMPFPTERLPSHRALRGEAEPESVVGYRVRATGEEFWSIVQSRAVRLGDSTERHVVTVMRDVTSLKGTEAALRFMSDTSATLFASLDYEETVRRMANAIVPRLADFCAFHLVDADGSTSEIVVAHRDPDIASRARSWHEGLSGASGGPSSIDEVLSSGKTLFVPGVTATDLPLLSPNSELLKSVPELAPASIIIAPMAARGRNVGAVTLVASGPSRRYTQQTVNFVEDLAIRCAMAIDNARLYQEARDSRRRVERQAERLRGLTHASLRINDELTLRDTLQSIADQARWITASNVAIAAITKDESTELSMASISMSDRFSSWDRTDLPGLFRRNSELLSLKEAMRIAGSDVNRLPGIAEIRRGRSLPALQGLLAVPIDDRDKRYNGVILVSTPSGERYSEHDEQILIQLALVASVAIDNVRLIEQAQAAVRIRDQFLSMAAHELKTPMTTVHGYVQLLSRVLEKPDPALDAVRRTASNMQEQVGRLEYLLDDLLDASKLQHQRVELNPTKVELRELVDQVVGRFQVSVDGQAEHRVEIAAPLPVTGVWDRDRVDQVLTNVISNAVKYSPEGGAIRIVVGVDGSHAFVDVADDGIGISLEDQTKLFEPFHRAAAARQTADGTGLGLFLSKQMVEQLGGEIRAVSAEGKGSTFTVRLPLIVDDGSPGDVEA